MKCSKVFEDSHRPDRREKQFKVGGGVRGNIGGSGLETKAGRQRISWTGEQISEPVVASGTKRRREQQHHLI